ncbi:MAG: transglutaminase family protein [Alphaproteobacteria bacterium]|nr:transglutaminase family protein [Alphaproteobacteria bacterium]
MQVLSIVHRTTYRYAKPVGFGEHRLLFRPRDSHDMRLVSSRLRITPTAPVRWMHDVFGNSVAVATFEEPSDILAFESVIVVEHYGVHEPDFPLEDMAREIPFSYDLADVQDLGRTIARHHGGAQDVVSLWAQSFLGADGKAPTAEVLEAMNAAIKAEFSYFRREEEGIQSPADTLRRRRGTCRDFALLMMEAARSLGLAARFVTGYVYDPAIEMGLDAPANGIVGGGATHAWLQIYLPGAGWVEYDPTNGIVGGHNLIRVGVARDPRQAIPLQGSFFGEKEDFVGMAVDVQVTAGNTLEPDGGKAQIFAAD